VERSIWKTHAYLSINQRFEWVCTDSCKRDPKIFRNRSIPPKLSVANSFNIDVEIESLESCDQVSCGFFTKRDLWKTMHRQTKCCKLIRSTDRHDPQLRRLWCQVSPCTVQYVAACDSVLQRVAACCSVLQRVAVCCNPRRSSLLF